MQNQFQVPVMETIDKTAETFGLSSYAVRKLARSKRGAAFTVKIGGRYLINQANFAAFLNCEDSGQDGAEPPEQGGAGIVPVPVKM